jgi:uncharacterized UPF0160 family protein
MTTILTHDGSFHADDIFAVATLLILYPDASVIRSREQAKIDTATIVVDAGMVYDPSRLRFDHHQKEGAGKRDNGIPYAAFGLIWKEFGEKVSGGQREASIIDNRLVAPLDANDNGVSLGDNHFKDVRAYSLVDFLYSYVDESEKSPEAKNEQFMSLLPMTKELLLREIKRAKAGVLGEDIVKKIYTESEDKRAIVLSEEFPAWRSALMQTPDALYAIYPRSDGLWSLKAVPVGNGSYDPRKALPEAWGGKGEEELQKVTGVADAVFAHRGLFMAAARSKEGAIALANLALNA